MCIQEGERRLILTSERDGKGMDTLHGSGRFEMHSELYWGCQKENILNIGGRIILKIMFENSMGVSAG